jgi:hypothetical protein
MRVMRAMSAEPSAAAAAAVSTPTTKTCMDPTQPNFTEELEILNGVINTYTWNLSKTTQMSLQPLLSNKFNLSRNYKEFKENFLVIADNLRVSSIVMGNEGHPITSVAVATLITTRNLLVTECLSTETSSTGVPLLYFEDDVSDTELGSVASLSSLQAGNPKRNKRRIVTEKDFKDFMDCKSILFTYLHTIIGANEELKAIANGQKGYTSKDPFLSFQALDGYFLRISGIGIVKDIVDLLEIRDNPKLDTQIRKMARLQRLRDDLELKGVKLPDILYQAILMLSCKDSSLRKHLNLEITKHLQEGTEYTLSESIETVKSYSLDEGGFKALEIESNDADKTSTPKRDKHRHGSKGGANTTGSHKEGEAALAVKTPSDTVLATTSSEIPFDKICLRCYGESQGSVKILYSNCTKHNKRLKGEGNKYSKGNKAHVVISNLSYDDVSHMAAGISESFEDDYSYAMGHALSAAVSDIEESEYVIADSACTTSIHPDEMYLDNLHKLSSRTPIVTVGNGNRESISARGHYLGCKTFVSKAIPFRLQSIPQLDKEHGAAVITIKGRMIAFKPTVGQCALLDGVVKDAEDHNSLIFDAKLMSDGLYKFKASDPVPKKTNAALVHIFPRIATRNLAQAVYFVHCCLGHMPLALMIHVVRNNLIKNFPSALTIEVIRNNWLPCKACADAFMKVLPIVIPKDVKAQNILNMSPTELTTKHVSNPINAEMYRASSCGEILCIDQWGPFPHATYSGYKFVNIAIDVFSGMPIAQFTKSPSQKEGFIKYVVEYCARHGHIVGSIRVDAQYVTNAIQSYTAIAYLPNAGIHIQQAAPGEHFTNPQVERFMQYVARRTTASLNAAHDYATTFDLKNDSARQVPIKAWGMGMLDAIAKLSLQPSSKHDNKTTRYELFFRRKPDWDMQRLLPFWLPVYALRSENQIDNKLTGHAFAGHYVGSVPGSKNCIQVFNTETNRVNIRRSFVPHVQNTFDGFVIVDDADVEQFVADNEFFLEDFNNPLVQTEDQAADLPIISSPCEGVGVADNQADLSVSVTDNVTTDHVPVITTENTFAPVQQADLNAVTPTIATSKPTPEQSNIRKSVRLAEKVASRNIHPAVHAKRFHKILVMYEKLNLGLTKRSKRSKRLRLRKGLMTALISKSLDPTTLKQAQHSEHATEWEAARATEDASLWGRGTFKELSDTEIQKLKREKVKILKSKYVFKKCIHADGSLKKFKVRLCVRGDLQDPSTYTDVYAGTVQRKAVFLLLAIANHKDLEVATADITSAFLYPELKEELYLELPDGRIVRLLRALYGLRQAANAFLNHLKEKLENIGFKQMMSDTCTFRLDEGDAFIILATHVDDLLFISNSKNLISKIKDTLGTHFDLTFYEEAHEFLGITITRDRTNKLLRLSQLGYIEKILGNFKLPNSERISRTPYHLSAPKKEASTPLDTENKQLYMQITGSLLYLAISTRPDILSSVHHLTRAMQSPKEADILAAYRVLRYLLLTPDLCLTFNGNSKLEVIGYADSSFVKNERNQFGYCFQLGSSSGCFVSVVKRTTTSAQSSTEAEYYALCEGCRELLWIRSFTREIGFNDILVKTIKQDNKSCISFSSQLGMSDRMKHVELNYLFVKTLVHERNVNIEYLKTKDMLADIFTKVMPADSFEYLRDLILGIPKA